MAKEIGISIDVVIFIPKSDSTNRNPAQKPGTGLDSLQRTASCKNLPFSLLEDMENCFSSKIKDVDQ